LTFGFIEINKIDKCSDIDFSLFVSLGIKHNNNKYI